MRWRGLHLFLALFWLLWSAVVVPMHRPGIISVDGAKPKACCATRDKNDKSPATALTCAICDWKAKLSSPPSLTLNFEPLGLAQWQIQTPTNRIANAGPLGLAWSRGPPLA